MTSQRATESCVCVLSHAFIRVERAGEVRDGFYRLHVSSSYYLCSNRSVVAANTRNVTVKKLKLIKAKVEMRPVICLANFFLYSGERWRSPRLLLPPALRGKRVVKQKLKGRTFASLSRHPCKHTGTPDSRQPLPAPTTAGCFLVWGGSVVF